MSPPTQSMNSMEETGIPGKTLTTKEPSIKIGFSSIKATHVINKKCMPASNFQPMKHISIGTRINSSLISLESNYIKINGIQVIMALWKPGTLI